MKGYKTMLFNGLVIVTAVFGMKEIQALIPVQYLPWVVAGVGLANMVLRYVTTTPVGRRE